MIIRNISNKIIGIEGRKSLMPGDEYMLSDEEVKNDSIQTLIRLELLEAREEAFVPAPKKEEAQVEAAENPIEEIPTATPAKRTRKPKAE